MHYEDVAGLLRATREKFIGTGNTGEAQDAIGTLAHSFSILFAADHPDYDYCGHCGSGVDVTATCPNLGEREHHSYVHHEGFNRKQFLAACGLKPARPYSTSMFRPVGEPGTGKTTGG